MKRELTRYFGEIRRELVALPRKRRKAILREHQGNVTLFLNENPKASLRDVEANFGTPDQVAESFLQTIDLKQTNRRIKVKSKVLLAICVALAALVTAIIVLGAIFVYDNHQYAHGYGEYTSAQEGFSESNPDAIATY